MNNKLYNFDKTFITKSTRLIVGVDEAGRGPLAGPVIAGAVILDLDNIIEGINDSKALSASKRTVLYDKIYSNAIAKGIGIVDNTKIDEINILNATKEAMKLAVAQLGIDYDLILIDYVKINEWSNCSRAFTKGDTKSASIAAASIIAKVTRDRIMDEYHNTYPLYNFAKHKGYPTKEHINNIKEYGSCPIHRMTFKPLKGWYNNQLKLL